MWVRLINSIHGVDVGFGDHIGGYRISGVWFRNVGSINPLLDSDFIPKSTYKIGMGDKDLFWEDVWVGDQLLQVRFKRLFGIETNQVVKQWRNIKMGCVVGDGLDI